MDNAENNATAMKELEELFKMKDPDITFDHKDNRIPCYPHIINICVSHILKSLTKSKAFEEDDDVEDDDDGDVNVDDDDEDENSEDEFDVEDNESLQEWMTKLQRDPVKRAHVHQEKVSYLQRHPEKYLSFKVLKITKYK